jgi:hypothetical protein
MAERRRASGPTGWCWAEILLGERGPRTFGAYHHGELFDTKESARASLQNHLDTHGEGSTQAQGAVLLRTAGWRGSELLVTCPPRHAWAVYPIRPGHSIEQTSLFFLDDHERELWDRLRNTRTNSATGSGCAVVALAALGAAGTVATAWARGRWGL